MMVIILLIEITAVQLMMSKLAADQSAVRC